MYLLSSTPMLLYLNAVFTTLSKPPVFFFLSDLGKVVDLFTDSVPQDNKHRYSHLHVALLCIVAQHLPHNGAEEAGR